MHENENTATDYVPDPARSRRDPGGTVRDAQGRLRVPLDRPDADIDGFDADHADADGPALDEGDPDDVALSWPRDGEGSPGDIDEDDLGDPREALLGTAQLQALAALPALLEAAMAAPFCPPVIDAVHGTLADALCASAGQPQGVERVRLQRVSAALALRALAEQVVEHAVFNAVHAEGSLVPEPVRAAYRARLEADAGVSAPWGGIAEAADLFAQPAAVTAATRTALERMEELAPGATRGPTEGARAAYGRVLRATVVTPRPDGAALDAVFNEPELAGPAGALWLLFPPDRPGLLELVTSALAEPGTDDAPPGGSSTAAVWAHLISLGPALSALGGAPARVGCDPFAVPLLLAVREAALDAAAREACAALCAAA